MKRLEASAKLDAKIHRAFFGEVAGYCYFWAPDGCPLADKNDHGSLPRRPAYVADCRCRTSKRDHFTRVVLGHEPWCLAEVPAYSSDMNAAWLLDAWAWEKRGWCLSVERDVLGEFAARVWDERAANKSKAFPTNEYWIAITHQATAPLAICAAMLLALKNG